MPFKSHLLLIFTCFLFAINGAKAQCDIEASILIDTLVCGDCVTLTAFGQGQGQIVFSENFDTGTPTGWAFTQQADFSNPCSPMGVDGTTHIWMGDQSGVPRELQTVSYDFTTATAGVTICFDMLFAEQGVASPCEGPDEPDEGVYLQYSIDNGVTWATVNYFDPNGGNDPLLINWNNWCFQLPAAALTANTQIRWFQDNDSGAAYDHWGIDNVQVYYNDPTYEIIWQHDGFSYGIGSSGGDNPVQVCPQTTTSYQVVMSNGTNTCMATVEVPVRNPDLILSATPDDSGCPGDCFTLNGEATVLVSPAQTPTYANDEFEVITGGFGATTDININVTGLNMQTVLPGSITEVCITNLTYFGQNIFPPGVEDIGNLDIYLQCPDGTQIVLIPNGTTMGDGTATGGYTSTCFTTGGADISTAMVPYTGSYNPSEPFNDLVGCTSNGLWTIILESNSLLSIGVGTFFGWSITFDDPEISFPADFSWSPTTNMTGANTLTPQVCPTTTTIYTLTVNDPAMCLTETTDVTITIDPNCCPIYFDPTITPPGCASSNGAINMNLTGASANVTYLWSTGATTNSITGLGAGSYTLSIDDATIGCAKDTTIVLTAPSSNLSVNVQTTPVSCNYNNVDCPYTGPAVVINEIMINPLALAFDPSDQAMVNDVGTGDEWVELYNPNPCQPVDISCYTVGSSGLGPNSGAFSFPPGTVIPPLGFLVLGGGDVGNININVFDYIGTPYLVIPTNQYWYLHNGNSWLGLYDTGGNVADAVFWSQFTTNNPGNLLISNGDFDNPLTVPAVCNYPSAVLVADQMSFGVEIAYAGRLDTLGKTVWRDVDAGTWGIAGLPTRGYCNSVCQTPPANANVCDGSITITTPTGTAPFTYTWSNNGPNQATATGLCPGTYTITVTDANNCVVVTSATLAEPVEMIATAAGETIACGLMDGDITLTLSGGVSPYNYNWNNGATVANPGGLGAGIYNLTITDAMGCITTATAQIMDSGSPTSTLGNSTLLCNGDMNGSLGLTVSGGTMPYSFDWDNAPDIQNPTGLGAGTYTVTVTDAAGCITVTSSTISEPLALSATIANTNPETCGQDNGLIDVLISGGTAGFMVDWGGQEMGNSTLSGQGTATIPSLQAGNYTITITDLNGCMATTSTTLSGTANLVLTGSGTNIACNGDSNGSVTVAVSGGTMPYIFDWDNAPNGQTATGLVAGTYQVTVTDVDGCFETTSVTINEPSLLTASAIGEMINCGASDGDITLTVSGGTLPYSFDWDNAPDVQNPSGLMTGTFNVTVSDANFCTVTATAQITDPGGITIAVTGSGLSCAGDSNGSLQVAITGGTAPYVFDWDNAPDVQNPTGLSAGSYTITLTDAAGCSTQATTTITEPPVLTITNIMTTPASCGSANDGSAVISASGGTGAYTYDWGANMGTSSNITGLSNGTYTVTISDANMCMVSQPFTITSGAGLTIAAIQVAGVSCFGQSDGVANAMTSGGAPPYSYLWNNGSTTDTASNLPGGSATVTITDSNGCSGIGMVMIANPVQIAITTTGTDASCSTTNDGVVMASASGGTTPYNYDWGSFGNGPVLGNLAPGTYPVTVTDANGCSVTDQTIIGAPPAPTVNFTTNPASCFNSFDGEAFAAVSGGLPPYMLTWDNGELGNGAFFLSGGLHVLSITDAIGCMDQDTVLIPGPDQLLVTNLVVTPVSCVGGNDGAAQIAVTGGTPPYLYSWATIPAQGGTVASNLVAGVYQVSVTDANGCEIPPINVTVGEPAMSLSASIITSVDPSCFGGDDGFAVVNVSGGVPSYTYTWNNGDTGPNAFQLGMGNYTVTVEDANGCQTIAATSLGQPEQLVSDLMAINNVCFGDEIGIIFVDTTRGGIGPYEYSLDGEFYQPDSLFTGLAAGNYSVFTQDMNGCVVESSIYIEELPELMIAPIEDETVELGDSIQITAVVAPDVPVTYSWTPMEFWSCLDTLGLCDAPWFLPLETTDYTVMATDTNGCIATEDFTLIVDKNRNIFIPNAFSPNLDGSNDVFMIFGGIGVATVRKFAVYDRWGEMLWQAEGFQPNDPLFGWDGNLKQKRLNPGVFVYYAEVEFIDGAIEFFKGDVTLLR